ncbi:MAG TPA: helix-turn-helix domain-containing protein [Streptosporangiaceae bacterium]
MNSAEERHRMRTISDVETLRVLADPLRLAILSALMDDGPEFRVMSVKELAEELGEPQTKLYRHIKQLEAAGLIRVAASRLVSGIVEQRYQASQRDISLGPELLSSREAVEESLAFVTVALNRYRDQFFAAHRANVLAPPGSPAGQPDRKPILNMTEVRVPAAKAAEIHARLRAIIEEAHAAEDPDGVPVSVLVGFLIPVPGQDGPPGPPGQEAASESGQQVAGQPG